MIELAVQFNLTLGSLMSDRNSGIAGPSRELSRAISTWEDENGSAAEATEESVVDDATQCGVPKFIDVDVVQLRMRVIALENLVIALVAEGSERQLELIREMASYISPRAGATHHPLTIRAAAQMMDIVERSGRFRR